jgi:uncharacterized protein (DUF433 family)
MATPTATAAIAAFTEEHVHRLTGVSQWQLRKWAEDNFFVPSLMSEVDTDLPPLRMYSFRDLVCLKVINAIRNNAKISLKELYGVKERLSYLGDDLWAKTTLYIHRKKVVFDNPESGEKEEIVGGLGVLQIPLKVVTEHMADAVRAMRQRNESLVGQIEDKKRGIAQPVIAGTRIPVKSIQAFSDAGHSVESIKEQYPILTEDDIRAAINRLWVDIGPHYLRSYR